MPVCTRNGCKKSFNVADNVEGSCFYHPGSPLFHEGLKGWNCCSKKVVDFNEFLNISGCTPGQHTDEKLPAPIPVKTTNSETNVPRSEKVESIEPTVSDSGVETYHMDNVKKALPAVPKLADAKELARKAEELEMAKIDDLTIEVEVGTSCKRRGCGYKFKNQTQSRGEGEESQCCFHPGAPVFHEGSKGWSCCKRKVLEFDEFLKIKGCKESKHLFAEVKSEELKEELVDCRFDWYQSQTQVILSIFAKKIDKATSVIEFKPNQLDVKLYFQGNKLFKRSFVLSQEIDPSNSKFDILSTKAEIFLQKANGIAWATLEPTDKITTWTTFGAGDSPLTPRTE